MSSLWNGQHYDRGGMPVQYPGNTHYGYGATPYPDPQLYAQPMPQQFYGQPPAPAYPPNYVVPVAQKSKLVAALLFFFLGELGIGNFYMGQVGRGITKLVLLMVTFFFAITIIGLVIALPLALVLGIWPFIEMILVLTGSAGYDRDARGVPLK